MAIHQPIVLQDEENSSVQLGSPLARLVRLSKAWSESRSRAAMRGLAPNRQLAWDRSDFATPSACKSMHTKASWRFDDHPDSAQRADAVRNRAKILAAAR
jgi:hypothetical protein